MRARLFFPDDHFTKARRAKEPGNFGHVGGAYSGKNHAVHIAVAFIRGVKPGAYQMIKRFPRIVHIAVRPHLDPVGPAAVHRGHGWPYQRRGPGIIHYLLRGGPYHGRGLLRGRGPGLGLSGPRVLLLRPARLRLLLRYGRRALLRPVLRRRLLYLRRRHLYLRLGRLLYRRRALRFLRHIGIGIRRPLGAAAFAAGRGINRDYHDIRRQGC